MAQAAAPIPANVARVQSALPTPPARVVTMHHIERAPVKPRIWAASADVIACIGDMGAALHALDDAAQGLRPADLRDGLKDVLLQIKAIMPLLTVHADRRRMDDVRNDLLSLFNCGQRMSPRHFFGVLTSAAQKLDFAPAQAAIA